MSKQVIRKKVSNVIWIDQFDKLKKKCYVQANSVRQPWSRFRPVQVQFYQVLSSNKIIRTTDISSSSSVIIERRVGAAWARFPSWWRHRPSEIWTHKSWEIKPRSTKGGEVSTIDTRSGPTKRNPSNMYHAGRTDWSQQGETSDRIWNNGSDVDRQIWIGFRRSTIRLLSSSLRACYKFRAHKLRAESLCAPVGLIPSNHLHATQVSSGSRSISSEIKGLLLWGPTIIASNKSTKKKNKKFYCKNMPNTRSCTRPWKSWHQTPSQKIRSRWTSPVHSLGMSTSRKDLAEGSDSGTYSLPSAATTKMWGTSKGWASLWAGSSCIAPPRLPSGSSLTWSRSAGSERSIRWALPGSTSILT